jgi:hypothetical protein
LITGAPLLLDEDPDELEDELLEEEEEELELDDELLEEELEEPLLLPPSPPPQPDNTRQTTSAAHTERREGSMMHPFWRRHFIHRNLTRQRGLVLQITQGSRDYLRSWVRQGADLLRPFRKPLIPFLFQTHKKL